MRRATRRLIERVLFLLIVFVLVGLVGGWIRSYRAWDAIPVFRIGDYGASIRSARGRFDMRFWNGQRGEVSILGYRPAPPSETGLLYIDTVGSIPGGTWFDDLFFWETQLDREVLGIRVRHEQDMLRLVPLVEDVDGSFAPAPTVRWSLAMPYWMVVMPFFLAVALRSLMQLRPVLRRRAGRCPNCGYDLRESPVRCPECGLARRDGTGALAMVR